MNSYQQFLLELYQHPKYKGALVNATQIGKGENISCGDAVEFQIIVNEEKITTIGHISSGCVVTQAAAELLARMVINKTTQEAGEIDFDHLEKELGIKLSIARRKCALVPLQALKQAIDLTESH